MNVILVNFNNYTMIKSISPDTKQVFNYIKCIKMSVNLLGIQIFETFCKNCFSRAC